MPIRIIATGGTFDKRYDPISGELGFGDTHLDEIVARARLAAPVTIESPMQRDSLDLVDADRALITDRCRRCPESRIVIVHGTDTMIETAGTLANAALPKCIVLTGAMVPYDLVGSDAGFNLGFAIASASLLDTGVWIAMNGRIHRWDRVRKNRERGIFEPV